MTFHVEATHGHPRQGESRDEVFCGGLIVATAESWDEVVRGAQGQANRDGLSYYATEREDGGTLKRWQRLHQECPNYEPMESRTATAPEPEAEESEAEELYVLGHIGFGDDFGENEPRTWDHCMKDLEDIQEWADQEYANSGDSTWEGEWGIYDTEGGIAYRETITAAGREEQEADA